MIAELLEQATLNDRLAPTLAVWRNNGSPFLNKAFIASINGICADADTPELAMEAATNEYIKRNK